MAATKHEKKEPTESLRIPRSVHALLKQHSRKVARTLSYLAAQAIIRAYGKDGQ